jgi:hypothetical protein
MRDSLLAFGPPLDPVHRITPLPAAVRPDKSRAGP